MKKLSVALLLIFCAAAVLAGAGEVSAAVQAGYIFDIEGTAQLRSADGKTITLKRSEHILYAVKEGDRISVRKGRVVVASLKESKGYEIGDNSEGLAKPGRMVAVRGKISELTGLYAPGGTSSGSMGGFVVRGVRPCIKAISPVSTTILDPAPVLSWENRCSGDRKVTVKIISGDTVVYSAESEGSSLKVPDKVLAYGNEYRWIVDSGKVNNVSGGVFSLPSEAEAEELGRKIAAFKERKEDLSFRLSYVFFLVDNNLNDLARAEIKTLKADFPENEHLKKMEESIR
ncbi:MAG TPA: hypothetical protein PKN85_09920 [Syntrophorhabdaceae bacterium]|nr:hypothetical protein [Syntrophorhabdaceae bacterium]HOD75699.1 hypothetical protein [Syntrophorhabdaceae bacterium]